MYTVPPNLLLTVTSAWIRFGCFDTSFRSQQGTGKSKSRGMLKKRSGITTISMMTPADVGKISEKLANWKYPDGNHGPKFGDLPNSKLLIAIGRHKITRG